MSLRELIDEYREVHNIHCLEGMSAVRKFNKFLGDLWYRDTYLENDNILNFLADNPGAIQALFDWIAENECQDWVENIESCLPSSEDEDEEEPKQPVVKFFDEDGNAKFTLER